MVEIGLALVILFLYVCSLKDRAEIEKLRQEVKDVKERREDFGLSRKEEDSSEDK